MFAGLGRPELNLREVTTVLFIIAPKYPNWNQLHFCSAEYRGYDASNCALRKRGRADGRRREKQMGFVVIE